jgi:predicted enzyme related to lactoylglutathione lyase
MKVIPIPQLAVIPVLVANQDEALYFYVEQLGLEKRTDITYAPGLRWLTVAPKDQPKPEFALAKLDKALQKSWINTASDATWVFDTEDCCTLYTTLCGRGVKFVSPPTKQWYGLEAIFEDPYGNVFSLLEPSPEAQIQHGHYGFQGDGKHRPYPRTTSQAAR